MYVTLLRVMVFIVVFIICIMMTSLSLNFINSTSWKDLFIGLVILGFTIEILIFSFMKIFKIKSIIFYIKNLIDKKEKEKVKRNEV